MCGFRVAVVIASLNAERDDLVRRHREVHRHRLPSRLPTPRPVSLLSAIVLVLVYYFNG